MVLHASVIEDVRTDLAAPFDFLLAGFHFGLGLTAFLKFEFVELRAQVAQSVFAVLRLVARFGVLDDYLVGLIGQRVNEFVVQAHTRFHFVDVLSSSAGAAEGVPT